MTRIRIIVLCLLVYSLGIKAQSGSVTIDDKCLVQFNGQFYDVNCYMEIPEGEDVQKYVSNIIFGEEDSGLKEAYEAFAK